MNFWAGLLNGVTNIFIFLGISGSLVGAYMTAAPLMRFDSGWGLLIGFGIAIGGTLVTLISASALKVLVYISRDVENLKTRGVYMPSSLSQHKSEWTCNSCKRTNGPYDTSCAGCGSKKHSTEPKPSILQETTQSEVEIKWQCKSCNQLNAKHNTFCTGCGEGK